VPRRRLAAQTRRDFLIYGAGVVAAAAGFWAALPPDTQQRLGAKNPQSGPRKERILNKALRLDDAVAAALYSPNRLVPTYDRSRALTPETLINNYDGQTPDPDYIASWHLVVQGLASGRTEHLALKDIQNLIARFENHDQVTRLVCVEGWSAIAWWGGLRFADFLAALPPMPGARWARLDSKYNLDSDGNPDPYYVSLDLPTARHPQTLLATQQSDRPLTVGHGAPLRLIAPMKLGLKNIKAISKITYSVDEPADYWSSNGRGYSRYDGL
jgi:DMSO/TMAO reductase YedYZ molybdopterin-dependent catalytic subunit